MSNFILNTKTGKMKEIKTEVCWIRCEILATSETDKYLGSIEEKFNEFLLSVLKENIKNLEIKFGDFNIDFKSVRNFDDKPFGILTFEFPVEFGNYANFVRQTKMSINLRVYNKIKSSKLEGNQIRIPVLNTVLNYEVVNSKVKSTIFENRPKEMIGSEITKILEA